MLSSAIHPMTDETSDQNRRRLAELKTEHRDLDDVIARMVGDPQIDQLMMQRMKKRKLALKDLIAKYENDLVPDIIA